MKEKADTWQMELTQITWEFEKLLSAHDLTRLNQKPDPNHWSPMEMIQHLILVNTSYFPIFDRLKNNTHKSPLLGKVPFVGKQMGKMILTATKKPMKTKTFKSWEPSGSSYNNDLLTAFFKQQDELSGYIQQLDPLLDRNTMISSPASDWIVYTLDDAFEIIIHHEKRHLSQLKSLLQ
ncbi:DinB superfamily protein [Cyclobacterium lianum]|uniref:DinB superfamily protein n=1 Tax=Cyclobacterium lianum TaxID=388280 RepID=A0A1M7LMV4_9BACT|nr:DinB family protein [Cyclobacterium lianum]SHM78951.1 DinB superfamily protein [Cyclobacterium lianum]